MDTFRVLFCGDPHGRFDHIVRAAQQFPKTPVVLLGDMEPQRDLLMELKSVADRLWWIHGNHDTDHEAVAYRVWDDKVAHHSIHARVVTLGSGLRIAGLGGVFRESVWHPDPGAARGGRPAFTNTTQSCFNPKVSPPDFSGVLAGCAGYLYFDNVHPTTAGHALLANAFAAAVPEPQIWALMLMGLVGVALARRHGTVKLD